VSRPVRNSANSGPGFLRDDGNYIQVHICFVYVDRWNRYNYQVDSFLRKESGIFCFVIKYLLSSACWSQIVEENKLDLLTWNFGYHLGWHLNALNTHMALMGWSSHLIFPPGDGMRWEKKQGNHPMWDEIEMDFKITDRLEEIKKTSAFISKCTFKKYFFSNCSKQKIINHFY